LALDIGVTKVRVVANKVRNREDEEYITSRIKDDLLGFVHYNQEVIDADRQGKSPFDFSDTAIREIQVIKDKIDLEYLEKNK
jgi:CO dehydrogenase maturation factor